MDSSSQQHRPQELHWRYSQALPSAQILPAIDQMTFTATDTFSHPGSVHYTDVAYIGPRCFTLQQDGMTYRLPRWPSMLESRGPSVASFINQQGSIEQSPSAEANIKQLVHTSWPRTTATEERTSTEEVAEEIRVAYKEDKTWKKADIEGAHGDSHYYDIIADFW